MQSADEAAKESALEREDFLKKMAEGEKFLRPFIENVNKIHEERGALRVMFIKALAHNEKERAQMIKDQIAFFDGIEEQYHGEKDQGVGVDGSLTPHTGEKNGKKEN